MAVISMNSLDYVNTDADSEAQVERRKGMRSRKKIGLQVAWSTVAGVSGVRTFCYTVQRSLSA